MSFIYSQALVVAFSEANCSGIDASAPSSGNPTLNPSLWHDKTMEVSRHSQYGMTCEPLTEGRGAELLTWWLEGFHVRPIPLQLREETLRTISGRKCDGSWQMSLPGTYLPRTSIDAQLTERQTTLRRWATPSDAPSFQRRTWVLTTFGEGIGYVHTPTCTANYSAPSMMKWPSARAFVQVFGKPTPTNHEWLMGWPIGWSGLSPLETAKSPNALPQHGESLEVTE